MKKILIVDDEMDFCSLLEEVLIESGYKHVRSCSDSTKAIPLILEEKPDLLLLDVNMPGISGDKIASELKKHPETENIPVIFLTGLVEEGQTELSKNMIGNNLFLSKPVRIKEFMEMVKSVLEG